MENNNDIKKELLQISEAVAAVPHLNVYTSPGDHYFDMLGNEVMAKIFRENSTEHSIPEGYFENFAADVMNKIKELDNIDLELPEVLQNLRKTNVYSVPEGYFETLDASISNHVAQQSKIISLPRRFPVLKYAIAASLTALLGLGIYKLANRTMPERDETLASVIATAKNINGNNSFDKEMTSLNEEEIVGYLNEKGDDVNAALVASLSDEQSLPDEEEYLTDENRLDDYLNEFNLSN